MQLTHNQETGGSNPSGSTVTIIEINQITMKTKIYIKSASNYYGRQIYFIYKDSAGECHTCASIIWDNRGPAEHLDLNPSILKIYSGYNNGVTFLDNNKSCFEIELNDLPCRQTDKTLQKLITDIIKNYLDKVLGVKAYKIEYLYKNHIKTFLRDYNQVKQQQAIINQFK